MNKRQLAAKIWESANNMRSKIEANEREDYVLGFIFYKFLTEREVEFVKSNLGSSDEEIEETLADEECAKTIRESIGRLIGWDDLFQTWLANGADFEISNVRDALSRFAASPLALVANSPIPLAEPEYKPSSTGRSFDISRLVYRNTLISNRLVRDR